MEEKQPIPLVGLIVTDRLSGEILLLHRRDHEQWQLPGGRIEEQDGLVPGVEASVAAAMRHANEELLLEIDEDRLHFLGAAPFRQWGKDYNCQYYEVRTIIDLAVCSDSATYDAMEKHNLFRLNLIRQPDYSANVVSLAGKLASDEILLSF